LNDLNAPFALALALPPRVLSGQPPLSESAG